MLNIVVPMAGRGSRFADAGYTDPKPLIPIHGVPMIALVAANLRPMRDHRFIFICQRDHHGRYDLGTLLPQLVTNCEVVQIDGVTDGAACTVLTAQGLIDDDQPLMIANSDQYVDIDIDTYLRHQDDDSLDGLIMTMTADDPKWSFVGLDDQGLVSRVVEKQVISNEATVGIYNFACGSDFVRAANAMIDADERVNGEFYVAPVYNRLIAGGSRIGIYSVGSENDGMFGLGIPTDLDYFASLPLSRRATENTTCR